MTDIDLFFQLIQTALGTADGIDGVPTEEEWAEMYKEAQRQTLLGVCFVGVQKICGRHPEQAVNLPAALKMKWLGAAAFVQDRNRLMNRRCVELQQSMASDGFRTCILKGQGVASFYGELAQLRQSGDIDIFVDADLATILKYLSDKGLLNDGWDYVHAHPRFFEDVEVELHYRLNVFRDLFLNRKFQKFAEKDKKEFFGNKVALAAVGEITIPSGWMNLFYLLHHIYRHLFSEGIGLRQVMDYYFALRSISLSPDDSDQLLMAVRNFGMERFARGLMWVLSNAFCMEENLMPWIPDEKEGRFILEDIMQSGNFGKLDNRYGKPAGNKIRKFTATLRRSLHLLSHYPSEALWTPAYYIWHFCWKRIKCLNFRYKSNTANAI